MADNIVSVAFKSLRPPTIDIVIDNIQSTETIFSVKSILSKKLQDPNITKCRLLYKSKPVKDTLTLDELVTDVSNNILFNVMQTPSSSSSATASPAGQPISIAAPGQKGSRREFWIELNKWLTTKLGAPDGEEIYHTFTKAYEAEYGPLPAGVEK